MANSLPNSSVHLAQLVIKPTERSIPQSYPHISLPWPLLPRSGKETKERRSTPLHGYSPAIPSVHGAGPVLDATPITPMSFSLAHQILFSSITPYYIEHADYKNNTGAIKLSKITILGDPYFSCGSWQSPVQRFASTAAGSAELSAAMAAVTMTDLTDISTVTFRLENE